MRQLHSKFLRQARAKHLNNVHPQVSVLMWLAVETYLRNLLDEMKELYTARNAFNFPVSDFFQNEPPSKKPKLNQMILPVDLWTLRKSAVLKELIRRSHFSKLM